LYQVILLGDTGSCVSRLLVMAVLHSAVGETQTPDLSVSSLKLYHTWLTSHTVKKKSKSSVPMMTCWVTDSGKLQLTSQFKITVCLHSTMSSASTYRKLHHVISYYRITSKLPTIGLVEIRLCIILS